MHFSVNFVNHSAEVTRDANALRQ